MITAISILKPCHSFSDVINHNLNYRTDSEGHGQILPGPAIELLEQLDHFVWLVVDTESEPLPLKQSNQSVGLLQRHAAKKPFADFLWRLPNAVASFHPGLSAASRLLHAPHIQLALKIFFNHPISTKIEMHADLPVRHPLRIAAENQRVEVGNDFVNEIRQAMRDRKMLRRERHNWNASSKENMRTLLVFLTEAFERHENLTVIHLRLFHSLERSDLIVASKDAQHSDLRALREARTRFFDRMRRKPSLFTETPSYVWAILPSLRGGYDLHLTLLLSTAMLQKVLADQRVQCEQTDSALADYSDQVGAYWVELGTGGRGSYLRGEMVGWLYGPDWIHGEVHKSQTLRRGALERNLSILAARRALVRLKDEPAGAYFGKSQSMQSPQGAVQVSRGMQGLSNCA